MSTVEQQLWEEGRDQEKCENREKKDPFIGEEVAAPSSWW
jgi:hypothetical protein